MTQKTTSKSKSKKYFLRAVQIAFILLISLCLVEIILSSLDFVINPRRIPSLVVISVAVAGIFVGTYAITELEKKLRSIDPDYEGFSTSLITNFKGFGYAALVVVIALGASLGCTYLLTSYFNLFPSLISSSLRLDILRTIVQADGFLIGLSGVMYAQLFWAINHQQSTLQVDILKSSDNESNSTDVRKTFVKLLDKKRSRMAIYLFAAVGALSASIFLSVSGMAQTGLYSAEATPTSSITIPLGLMMLGIVILAISIVGSKMSLSDELEESNNKTPDEQESSKKED